MKSLFPGILYEPLNKVSRSEVCFLTAAPCLMRRCKKLSWYSFEALVVEPPKLPLDYFSEKFSVNNPWQLYAGQANILRSWSCFPLAASLFDCYSGDN